MRHKTHNVDCMILGVEVTFFVCFSLFLKKKRKLLGAHACEEDGNEMERRKQHSTRHDTD